MQTLRNKLLFNSQVLVVATKQVNNIYLLYRVSCNVSQFCMPDITQIISNQHNYFLLLRISRMY